MRLDVGPLDKACHTTVKRPPAGREGGDPLTPDDRRHPGRATVRSALPWTALLLLTLPALAGCLGDAGFVGSNATDPAPPADPPPGAGRDVQLHGGQAGGGGSGGGGAAGNGTQGGSGDAANNGSDATTGDEPAAVPDVPAELLRLDAGLFGVTGSGAENTIGAAPDGTLHYLAGTTLLSSSDQGRTWDEVSVVGSPASLDPYLHVDPVTGRIFVDHLWVGCSWLSVSDDGGQTWLTNPLACGRPVNDHQKVATGPRATPVPGVAYPRATYYCWNEFAGVPGAVQTGCSVSHDGGLTWPVVSHLASTECDSGFVGNVAVLSDGTALAANSEQCDAGVVVWRTTNDGVTWQETLIPVPGGTESIDPDIAVDGNDTAYVVFRANDHLTYLSRSADGGQSWSDPVRVSPPGVRSTVFQAMAAGSAGRVGIGYLGTEDTAEGADDAPDDAAWHLYVTVSLDADAKDPTFATVRVTDDPVQVGCFGRMFQDEDGGDCDNGNHLDFIDATADRDGRFYVAVTDGCDPCEDASGSADDTAKVGVVTAGPSLLADIGELDPLSTGDGGDGGGGGGAGGGGNGTAAR